MRGRDRRRVALAAAVMLAAGGGAGCGSSSAPRGWLTGAADVGGDPYGGWAEVRGWHPEELLQLERIAHGELIAVEHDGLWLLPRDAPHARFIPRKTIVEVKVTRFDTNAGTLAAWTALGTLSTASHGVGLIISAPVWIIGGAVATRAQSRHAVEDYPRSPWDRLAASARFPGGLPEGLEPTEVTSKRRAAVPVSPPGGR